MKWFCWLADDASSIVHDGTTTTPKRRFDIFVEQKLIRLSRRYIWALRKHLRPGRHTSLQLERGLQLARGLGHQAVILGLETLDVARIHAGALATLEASSSRDGIIERAELFFSEAISPIEKTHGAALEANDHLNQVAKTLGERTQELAAANRSLKQGIAQRKAAEKALKSRSGHSRKLLAESCRLHKHLRHLTHQILSTQENERKKISLELQDEIAQTLLGINARLLSLKRETTGDAEELQKEIASTRQLVDKSRKSIKRFAREFGKQHET